MTPTEFDFIIAGCSSAASVVAMRLVRDFADLIAEDHAG
jgi:hypothetical protein